MGYDGKYGRVTTEHGDIPDDEPVIVFRGGGVMSSTDLERFINGRTYEWQDLRNNVVAPSVSWRILHDAEAASAIHDLTRSIDLRGNRDEEFKSIVREARQVNLRLAQAAYRRLDVEETRMRVTRILR